MKIIKNFSKVLIVAITIFSIIIISSCSKDGEPGTPGTNGTNASIVNSGFHVVPTISDQIVPNVTFTKVQFGREITDDMNSFNTSTSELTIPTNGFYHFSATVNFATILPDNSAVVIEFRKNNVVFKSFSQRLGVVPSININGNFSLVAGEVITVFIFHNSSNPQNINRIESKTFFTGYRVY